MAPFTLPERVERAEILEFLLRVGLVPEEVAELQITPTTVVAHVYDIDDDGRIAIADGEVVRHRLEIPIRD